MAEAPTLEYILGLRSELQALHITEDVQIDRHRRVRTLEQTVALDEQYRLVNVEVRDATIADEDWRTAATLSNRRPKMQVKPSKPGDTAQERATLQEHWTEEVLWEAGKRRIGMHAYKACVDACIGDGAAWSKLLIDQDLWDVRYSISEDDYDSLEDYNNATDDAKKVSGSPFIWLVPDVRTIYPVWTGTRLTEVLEWQRRPMYSTMRKYGLGRDEAGNLVPEGLGQPTNIAFPQPTAQFLDFCEHWNDGFASYVVAGTNIAGETTAQRVAQWPHKYKRPPYFPAFGLMAGFWANRKVGWAASENKRWLVEYRSFLETLMANVAAHHAFPLLKRTRAPGSLVARDMLGDDKRPKDQQRWDLREIIDLDPGEDIEFLEPPAIAAALSEELKRVDEAIRKLEPPRIATELGGTDLGGAGWAYSQVLTESRLRYADQVAQLENMLVEMTKCLWQWVRDIVGETVYVMAGSGKTGNIIGAGPDDLAPAIVNWEIDPEVPSAKLIEWRLQHERLKAGTQNLDDAWTEMGENPDEKRRGAMLDEIRQQPWYKQALFLHTLQEIGRGDMLADAAQAQTYLQPGAVTGQGGPQQQGVPQIGQQAASPGPMPSAMAPGTNPGQMPGAVVPEQGAAAGMMGR